MSARLAALAPLAALLLTGASAAPAPVLTVDDFPAVTDDALSRATLVRPEESLGYAVSDFSGSARIRPLAGAQTEGEETVVTLATDILFGVDDATVPAAAVDEIAALLTGVPQGAAVAVEGHTDSVASEAHNQDLSERRAAAVADAVRSVRPDLAVTATGYGESRLKVDESGDDVADDRAQNRRGELRNAATQAGAPTPVPTPSPVLSVPPRTGTTPAVRLHPTDVDPVAQVRVPSPAFPGVDVVVGVEEVVVRGAITEVSLLLSLEGDLPAPGDRPHLYDALDGRGLDVTLVDRAALLQYAELTRVHGVIHWVGEGEQIGVDLESVHRYVVTFPRLLSDEGPVDVVLDPELPVLADVPVTRT